MTNNKRQQSFWGKLGLRYFLALALVTSLIQALPDQGQGYIMPAEQLIQFMAANFSKFQTLVITQSTQYENQGDKRAEKVFEEKIWMRSPSFFHSEIQSGNRITVIGVYDPNASFDGRPALNAHASQNDNFHLALESDCFMIIRTNIGSGFDCQRGFYVRKSTRRQFEFTCLTAVAKIITLSVNLSV